MCCSKINIMHRSFNNFEMLLLLLLRVVLGSVRGTGTIQSQTSSFLQSKMAAIWKYGRLFKPHSPGILANSLNDF